MRNEKIYGLLFFRNPPSAYTFVLLNPAPAAISAGKVVVQPHRPVPVTKVPRLATVPDALA